jgi:hypothetical protein
VVRGRLITVFGGFRTSNMSGVSPELQQRQPNRLGLKPSLTDAVFSLLWSETFENKLVDEAGT